MMWMVACFLIGLWGFVSLLITAHQCLRFYEWFRQRQHSTRVLTPEEEWTEASSLATTNPEAYVRDTTLYGCAVMSEEEVDLLHRQMERNPLFLTQPLRSNGTMPMWMTASVNKEIRS